MPTHQGSTAPVRLPDESPQSARIKVVGVGGGGSNAIDRMIDFGVEGVEFIALNTDIQALEVSKAPVRGQLGSILTNGLSAGSDPNVGRRAAIQDANEIAEVLEGADMVFITAGLGGGTGTGAAPVIAAIASEMGALTVAIVTRPFNFEGKRRMAIADWGIDHLLRYVDTLIVIPNEKLLALAKDAPFFESFKIADDFLRQAVQGISDIITTEGVINRDFADVKTTMAGMGYAVMGTASRSGPNRAVDAVMDAMASPLLEEGAIDGARGILINITGSSSLRLSEVNAASRVIQSVAHEDANIIFGAVLDERLGDEVKATVIATGFRNDGRDRSERRARLLRAAGPQATQPEAIEPQVEAPIAEVPQVEIETSALETPHAAPPSFESVRPEEPVVAHLTPAEPEAVQSADTETVNAQSIAASAPEQEPSEIAETVLDVSQLQTPDVPELQTTEVEQPEALSEQTEETARHTDPPLAIEVYLGEELRVEDPPQRYVQQRYVQETEDALPAGVAVSEETHTGLTGEEEDWRAAIREIARLAEPAFELGDKDDGTHPDRLADTLFRPVPRETKRHLEATGETEEHDVVAQQQMPPKVRPPVSPIDVPASPYLSNTRRTALAAYAAVSPLETEPETEPEEPQTMAVNAFAQVLEARRRFVENLGNGLPAEESAHPREHRLPEQRRAYPSRPRTIEAETSPAPAPTGQDPGAREELHPQTRMPIIAETAAHEAPQSGDLEVDDLSWPLPASNRRPQRQGTEQRNGELFESHWNSEIPVPSFGSILERKS